MRFKICQKEKIIFFRYYEIPIVCVVVIRITTQPSKI